MKILSFEQSKQTEETKQHFINLFIKATEQLRLQSSPLNPPSIPIEQISFIFNLGQNLFPIDSLNAWIAFEDPTPSSLLVNESFDTLKPVATLFSNLRISDPKTAYFSLIEGDKPEALTKIIQTAETWMTEKGAKESIGPLCLNTFLPYRFRKNVSPETSFFRWEPSFFDTHCQHFIQSGYQSHMTYHSTGMTDIEEMIQVCEKSYLNSLQKGYSYEFPEQLKEEDLKDLFQITMESFKDNDYFDPISYPLFQKIYSTPALSTRLEYFSWVKNKDQKRVGYLLAFKDRALNKEDKNEYIVWKSLVVHPSERGEGLSHALLYVGSKKAKLNGLKNQIGALIRSGNKSESSVKKQSNLWKNEYQLLRKELL